MFELVSLAIKAVKHTLSLLIEVFKRHHWLGVP